MIKRILIDMDNTIADFDGVVLERLHQKGVAIVDRSKRTTFYIKDDFTPQEQQLVSQIYHEPGFFEQLPMLEGAKQALSAMKKAGLEVLICSHPLHNDPNCALEKKRWITTHLGESWLHQTVFTYDKTLAQGDLLIDDRPTVSGRIKPSWQHVLFHQPYNAHLTDKPRLMHWNNWRELL